MPITHTKARSVDVHTQLNDALIINARLKDEIAQLKRTNEALHLSLLRIQDLISDARRTTSSHT